jgi:predicted SprT family Zn-dependent metalloprotease
VTSDPKLRRWLLHFNRKHFNGSLPVDRITIYYEPCGVAAATTLLEDDEYVIRVDPALMGFRRYTKLIVNHEMVHVLQWRYSRRKPHGTRFDQEIQRLCTFRTYRKLL